MTAQQSLVYAVLAVSLVLFASGKWRYDMVALLALLTLILSDVVPAEEAFQAFGHPAVITVAAALVLGQGLKNSGFVDLVSKWLSRAQESPALQTGKLTVTVAALSSFINNVAAMALLMPVAITLARRSGRAPSLYLLPLAFASLLGGLVTLIGTPSNIIVAAFRTSAEGEPFTMFDFTPVGASVAVAGVLFLALVGRRLVPLRQAQMPSEELFKIDTYFTELEVPEGAKFVGKPIHDIEAILLEEEEVTVLDLVRDGRRIPAPSVFEELQPNDVLVVEASAEALKIVLDATGLKLAESKKPTVDQAEVSDVEIMAEAVVTYESPLRGSSARELDLRQRYGINVLAAARYGSRIEGRLSSLQFLAGDILLLQGARPKVNGAFGPLGCLPLAERGLSIGRSRRLVISVALFGAAIAASATGLVAVQVALVSAAVGMVLFNVLNLREAYDSINWPIIVLLGAMIPVGQALESTGGTRLLAEKLLDGATWLQPEGLLMVVLIAGMLLSSVVNNAAAAVVMAPIAIALAKGLGVSPDPFLMAVAIGVSSSYLTPISHQSNTLAMEAGGYKFSDYLRAGLALEVVVLAVSFPLILLVWPLR